MELVFCTAQNKLLSRLIKQKINILSAAVLFSNLFSKYSRYPNQWREIAIDPQVKTADGQIYDIIFIGTDKV